MLDKAEIFETRVRECAFRLWQEAGCPENEADAFWYRAREIQKAELNLTDQDLARVRRDSATESDAADFA